MNAKVNVCSMCGKPIMGYYYELGDSLICYGCGAISTLSNLHNRGIIDTLPDIIEVDGTEKSEDTNVSEQATIDAVYSDLNDEKEATPEQVDAFSDVTNSVYGVYPEQEANTIK